MPDNRPYVYAIYVDSVLRYIGKGRNGRMHDHVKIASRINAKRVKGEKVNATKFYNRLAKALRGGATVTSEVLVRFETEQEAFAEEVRQIAARGGLWNTFSGGEGFTSDYIKSQWETNPKLRKNQALGAGKKLREQRTDPDFNKRLQAGIDKLFSNADYVAKHAAEKSAIMKELRSDPEFIKRQSKATTDMLNDRWTDIEYKERMRLVQKNNWNDPILRQRMSGNARKYFGPCSIDGCDRIAEKRGWCAMHYGQWYHGRMEVVP